MSLPSGGLGLGGRCWQKSWPPGGGVSSHFPPPPTPGAGRGGEAGKGAGQGRKRARAVFVAALPSGTDGWGGERVRGWEEEGCGGRRMRNEEFRRPESPRRSPPPHLFPERGAGQRLPFSPGKPWPLARGGPRCASSTPGRAPHPRVPPRGPGGRGRGSKERPGRKG